MHWRDDAKCRDYPPDWWFPDIKVKRLDPEGIKAAMICHGCPAKEDCRVYAEVTPGTWGVWGGELFRDGRIQPH